MKNSKKPSYTPTTLPAHADGLLLALADRPGGWHSYPTFDPGKDMVERGLSVTTWRKYIGVCARNLEARGLVQIRRSRGGMEVRLLDEGRAHVERRARELDEILGDHWPARWGEALAQMIISTADSSDTDKNPVSGSPARGPRQRITARQNLARSACKPPLGRYDSGSMNQKTLEISLPSARRRAYRVSQHKSWVSGDGPSRLF